MPGVIFDSKGFQELIDQKGIILQSKEKFEVPDCSEWLNKTFLQKHNNEYETSIYYSKKVSRTENIKRNLLVLKSNK